NDAMALFAATRCWRSRTARKAQPVHAQSDRRSGGIRCRCGGYHSAGDAFMAALISGVLEAGDELEDQLVEIGRFACAAGAITTTSKGAIPALPTRQQVYDFLSAT
ncbi:MAG: putative fructokinase, partial [Chloroflexi bacterium OLB15]